MTIDPQTLARRAGELLEEARARRPLVQNVTNFVSMDIAANALLALGASPAMIHAPEETDEFTLLADALVVNVGTLSAPAAISMERAAAAARMHGKPWLLDPVAAGLLSFRDDTIRKLLRHRPSIIRGNASEIMAMARIAGLTQHDAAPRGVDNRHQASEAEASAVKLARHCFCAVVATGAIDVVTDGASVVRLGNGSPLAPRVTALGCSMSSVMGAYLALTDPFEAALAATILYGVAGDIAAEGAQGPASFRTSFLDTLYSIGAGDLAARIKVIR
ncbi:MAG: hydroxyethylthiazole kinase [Beijerinckiaceae bacterium]